MSIDDLVRSWKDPDARMGIDAVHPAGEIVFQTGGNVDDSVTSLTPEILSVLYCGSIIYGTCSRNTVGCC